jgi:uncharacterized protein YutE (UPF0331/DUF86 family)
MSSISVIESKISSIKKYLGILKRFKDLSKQEIEEDLTKKGALERYLYLATQASIDLAEAIIAYKEFRRPTTYSESFYILEEEEFLTKELSDKLVNMTKFRNIIAHDYENVDFSILYDAVQNRLGDIEEFIRETQDELRI